MSFAFALEHDQFKTRDDDMLMLVSPTLPVGHVWPWPEVFRTRKSVLLEDVRSCPDFPWRDHVVAQGIISILVVPMVVSDEVAGVIGVRFAQRRHCSEAEMALAQALANQCMLTVALNRLMSRTRETSVLIERNRIARDLHDTIAQGLTGIIVQLEATADAYAKGLLTEADGHAALARKLARDSLQEARRAVHALRPRALEDKDLCEALRQLARQLTRETKTRFDLTLTGQPIPLPARWEENILRIGQEAMTNAIRHAAADHVSVRMAFGPNDFTLHIRDDGKGFNPARRHDGFGLQGIAERVEEMGGRMQIDSAPGAGSEMFIALPISPMAGSGANTP
jgi:signal transduction histidine kinase